MYAACASGNQPRRGAITHSAEYMPSANSEPCARLIVSITPTISMKPSATSANSSPSVSPLNRCGSRLIARRSGWRCASALVARRALVALELAGLRSVRIDHVLGLALRQDLEDVGLLRRRVVVGGHVDRLLALVR